MSSQGSLNYGNLMQKAMRRMMAEVLSQIAEDGLPGDHHFYISFDTCHPGVDIPDSLRATYPEEMTIVLQEWFKDLAVLSDRFAVTLNFSEEPKTLVIPLEAVRTFVDPSVKFGLKFDAYEREDDDGVEPVVDSEHEDEAGENNDTMPTGASADVVSLDQFRKS